MSRLMNALRKSNKEVSECITSHQLDFEMWEWDPNDTTVARMLGITNMETEYQGFRIGTCEGLWTSRPAAYVILSVINDKPGNGHFEDVLQWFYHSCRRDRKDLIIEDFFNMDFKRHMIEKRGFKPHGTNDAIKLWHEMPA